VEKAGLEAAVAERADLLWDAARKIWEWAEPGYQETKSSALLASLVEEEGFEVTRGVAGIPTSFVASFGAGRPVIAILAEFDALPGLSQEAVPTRSPRQGPDWGHACGHHLFGAGSLGAALAVADGFRGGAIGGTVRLYGTPAEEGGGAKAFMARAGLFDDVDIVLYSHVSSDMTTSWGESGGNGMVSVEYLFEGESAHGAGSPWDGRSALDAVELMNIGWNFRREHLRIQQRSHYVITDGGDQPNVVPPTAAVWYFFRETDYPNIMRMWELGDRMADGAALMTSTTVESRVLGAAWPQHMNRPLAEAVHANMLEVGMPEWSEKDQRLARALQKELGVEERGLPTTIGEELRGRADIPDSQRRGGGSDDIGDISWVVPTVVLRFPSNIPGGQNHNWNKSIAMATPIAHKGATAAAKVFARTLLDILLTPSLVDDARDYFETVQKADTEYTSFLRPEDEPAIWLNAEIMRTFKPQLEQYYYDPSRYETYLEQLGIEYPTIREGE